MSKKKSRTLGPMQSAHAGLASKSTIGNKAFNNGISLDPLYGMEDISQLDSSGMPFILVDGVCARNRQQLHVALSKREKKCMKRIKRQCSALPWLEHTRPVADSEPMTEAEKDAQDELNFQADLKLLQLDMLRVEEKSSESQLTETLTPIAHAVSTEDLSPSLSRIEEIRIQLEKLREQQQREPIDPLPTLAEQLRIRRQATFDIERDAPISKSSSTVSLDSHTPILSQRRLTRATTISQLPRTDSRPSLQKMHSSTCLCGESNTCCKSEPQPTDAAIANKIEDLLMQQEKQRCFKPGAFSYGLGANKSKVEPLGLGKTRSLMLPATLPYCDKIIQEQTVNIVAAATSLQAKSRTFLKVPRLFKTLKK